MSIIRPDTQIAIAANRTEPGIPPVVQAVGLHGEGLAVAGHVGRVLQCFTSGDDIVPGVGCCQSLCLEQVFAIVHRTGVEEIRQAHHLPILVGEGSHHSRNKPGQEILGHIVTEWHDLINALPFTPPLGAHIAQIGWLTAADLGHQQVVPLTPADHVQRSLDLALAGIEGVNDCLGVGLHVLVVVHHHQANADLFCRGRCLRGSRGLGSLGGLGCRCRARGGRYPHTGQSRQPQHLATTDLT